MFLSQKSYDVSPLVRYTTTALYIISGLVYLSWRLTVFNPSAQVLSTVFYLAEVYGFLMSLIIIMLSCQKKTYERPIAASGLSVDVFITTYHEPLAMVRRTAIAARRISYPHKTYILDDGNRAEIREMAISEGCYYLARKENIGAKAGNLNNGLKYSDAEFIALLDADHVPQTDFLDKLLGYFKDKQICFVQTPQDYFNLGSYQHVRDKSQSLIWHEQSFFHYVGQLGRDFWNATTHCGCSVVMRRSCLDQIGGFPTETVTEDMHASVKLQKLGYKTAYHAEPLAFGVAANDFQEFVRQRLRWGEGNMQVCREEGLPFFCKGLTLPQRLCYFALTSTYLDGWQKAIYYIMPAYVLFTQIPPIWADPLIYTAYFVPYLVLTYLFFEEMGRGYGRMLATERFAMARLGAAIIATFGLIRKRIKFKVSSKSLIGRLPPYLLLPQIIIAIANLAAIAITVLRPYINQPLYMPTGIAIFISTWAIVIFVLSTSVIVSAIHSSTKREEDYMFEVPLAVELVDSKSEKVVGLVNKVSLSEFEFELQTQASLSDLIQGYLYLPSRRLPFIAIVEHARLEAGKLYIAAKFKWENTLARDDLEHLLYAGRWTRLANSQSEFVQTPLQQILNFVKNKSNNGELKNIRWLPILYHEIQSEGQCWQYGLVNYQNNKINQLMCFSTNELSIPTELVMLELTCEKTTKLLIQCPGAELEETFGLPIGIIYKTSVV